jgi:hypothetical protein
MQIKTLLDYLPDRNEKFYTQIIILFEARYRESFEEYKKKV